MKVLLVIAFLLLASISFAEENDGRKPLLTDDQIAELNGTNNKPILLALNCIKPIKPILPIKPIWCTGTWALILQCDQYCNCEWVPTCLE